MFDDPHAGFIAAAYAIAAVVLGSMIFATISDYRSLRKALARFGERGSDRA